MYKGFYGLWYDRPATEWIEALPIGNGRFGGMIYGGIQHETISVNEETVWEGTYTDRSNPKAIRALADIRKAIFEGRYADAEAIGEDMLGVPNTLNCYQPLCDVDIRFAHTGIFTDYKRGLDLERALHTLQFRKHGSARHPNGALYRREYFVSAPDRVMVIKMTTENEKGMDADICLNRFSSVKKCASGTQLTLSGQLNPEETGVRFAGILRAFVDQGEVFAEDGVMKIRSATTIELRIAGATNYAGGDEMEKCLGILDEAERWSYDELKQRHIQDYQALYKRQRFSLGGDPSQKPTNELIDAVHASGSGAALYELWYNYLRYQLISTSRPGCQPSNLQGIWNDNMAAPWNSDYHPNVNMQINYWPAEGYGLPECVEPLVDWLEKIAEAGRRTAREHYNARGWVLHHISDIFYCTTPMDGPWGIWPFGGAWLCRHLFEHYLYNRDKEFLRARALPMIRGSVEFMLDFLMECPKGIPGEGYMITCPSHSPENRFVTKDGEVTG